MNAFDYIKPYMPPGWVGRYTGNGEWIGGTCPFNCGRSTGTFYINTRDGFAWCHREHRGWNLEELLKGLRAPLGERNDIISILGHTRKSRKAAVPVGVIPESILGLFQNEPEQLLTMFDPALLQHEEVGFSVVDERIIFPVRDEHGVLVAISGRATRPGDTPRYRFYGGNDKVIDCVRQFAPTYTLNRRPLVWRIHKVIPDLVQYPYLLVVEGFKAALWLLQCGYKNVVCIFGSIMTQEQEDLLVRLNVPIYLFLDNDEAGIDGTFKMGERLRSKTKVFVCPYKTLETREQPDSLTPEQVNDAISGATPYGVWKRSEAMTFERQRVTRNREKADRQSGGGTGDKAAKKKYFNRKESEIIIPKGKDRGYMVHPVKLEIVDPRDPLGNTISETYPFLIHNEKFKPREKGAKFDIKEALCSAGWNDRNPKPCNGCRANEDGTMDIEHARQMEALQVVLLEHIHNIHVKTERGTEYDKWLVCTGRTCKECGKSPKDFGRAGFIKLGKNHFGHLLDYDAKCKKLCKVCHKEIWVQELYCSECGKTVLDVTAAKLADADIEPLIIDGMTCTSCGKFTHPLEFLACAGDCENPERATIFDCSFRIERTGEGTGSALAFDERIIEPMPKEVAHLAEPLDFEKVFAQETLAEQATILGCPNFYADQK
jgi:hypothetical protein